MTALVPAGHGELDTGVLAPHEQLANAFLLGYDSLNTRLAYRHNLTRWFEWCTVRGIDPLQAARRHIDGYARQMETTATRPASVAQRLSTLARYYRYALVEDVIAKNPTEHIRRPAVNDEASQRLGLGRGQARELLTVAAERPKDNLLTHLLLVNGLRASEAAGIQVEHLGHALGHRTLWLTGKGGKEVTVPLPARVIAALEHYLELQGRPAGGPLFRNEHGRPLTRKNVDKIIARLGRRIGIPNLRPHDLRHTAVTLELEAGVPLEEVQDFARHADPRTTQRYNRARRRLDNHASYRLAAYL